MTTAMTAAMMPLLVLSLLAPPREQSAPPPVPLIDVVLMVDVSHSLTFGFWARDRGATAAAGNALAAAMETGDQARVGVFGTDIVLDPAPLASREAVVKTATALSSHVGGPSPVWDAVDAAAAVLKSSTARRGIILITDGRATGNRLGFADMLARVRDAGIPVFVISFDRNDRIVPDPGARLIELAKATGGTCWFIDKDVLPGAIRRAMTSLRALR